MTFSKSRDNNFGLRLTLARFIRYTSLAFVDGVYHANDNAWLVSEKKLDMALSVWYTAHPLLAKAGSLTLPTIGSTIRLCR